MATYAQIIKKKATEWGAPDMMTAAKEKKPRIPFSSPQLNYSTYGGLPRGCITEYFGNPSGGKSTTALDSCYNAMKVFNREHEDEVNRLRGLVASGKKEYSGPLEDLIEKGPKRVLYMDLEHTFDWKWAGKMGLNEGDIDVMQPPDVAAEDELNTLLEILPTEEVGFIVIDSIPTLVPNAVLEKKLGERTVASLAGLMTTFLQKVVPLLARYDCTLLLINQIRENMDNPYVIKTPGGRAIEFYSTLRIFFRQDKPVDFAGNELNMSAEDPAGYIIAAKIMKQKSAPNNRKVGAYYLMLDSGIRPDFDYAKLAIEKYGIIKKSGGWYTMCNPETGEILEEDGKTVKVNGALRVYDYLNSNSDYYANLVRYIDKQIEEGGI